MYEDQFNVTGFSAQICSDHLMLMFYSRLAASCSSVTGCSPSVLSSMMLCPLTWPLECLSSVPSLLYSLPPLSIPARFPPAQKPLSHLGFLCVFPPSSISFEVWSDPGCPSPVCVAWEFVPSSVSIAEVYFDILPGDLKMSGLSHDLVPLTMGSA